jgi:hypothetical protein
VPIKSLTIYAVRREEGESWAARFEEAGVRVELESPPPPDYHYALGGKTSTNFYDGERSLARLLVEVQR